MSVATLSEHAQRYVAAHDHYLYARARYDEAWGPDDRELRRALMVAARDKLSQTWKEWLDHKRSLE